MCSTLEPLYCNCIATAVGGVRFINIVDSGQPTALESWSNPAKKGKKQRENEGEKERKEGEERERERARGRKIDSFVL